MYYLDLPCSNICDETLIVVFANLLQSKDISRRPMMLRFFGVLWKILTYDVALKHSDLFSVECRMALQVPALTSMTLNDMTPIYQIPYVPDIFDKSLTSQIITYRLTQEQPL